MADAQDTVSKQSRTRGLRPFKKGDPRINRSGRPKSFDHFRELAQKIINEGNQAEAILRSWAKNPRHQRDLIEYAFGKVPEKIEATGLENKTVLVLHFDHEKGVTQQ